MTAHSARALRLSQADRANAKAFTNLIAVPATGQITLPGRARLKLRSVAGCIAGTTSATVVSASTQTLKTSALAAGGETFTFWGDKGVKVTPAVGFELLLDTGLGVYKKIAQG